MKTRDYQIFKNITGNRNINIGHAESLADAIERKNLLRYFPVLVNEDMEVIDGQHRLMAAAKLDYEIHYEIVPGLKLEDVMSINTHSKNWSIADFVDAYIRLGNKEYSKLLEFHKQYGLSITMSASLLSGMRGLAGGGRESKAIKSGDFHIGSEVQAKLIAEQVNELRPHADFEIRVDRELVSAMLLLHNNENFDFDRLIAKLHISGTKITKRPSARYYLIQIEELYNFHNSTNKVELYASSQA